MRVASTFRFLPEEYFIKEAIVTGCRNVLARPALQPGEAFRAACMLWLAMGLPEHRSEYYGRLSVTRRGPESYDGQCVTIGADGLELDTREGFDCGCGWDHDSRTEFAVSIHGRHARLDSPDLEDWLALFCQRCEDPEIAISMEWDSEEGLPPLDEVPGGEPWDQLWSDDE